MFHKTKYTQILQLYDFTLERDVYKNELSMPLLDLKVLFSNLKQWINKLWWVIALEFISKDTSQTE